MNDFFEACVTDIGVKRDDKAFKETFCARCRNRECFHSGWSGDKFAARVAAQPDRMLKPASADPKNPKYAMLADFVDNLREAMRLEIADRRGDWEVPEIPIVDGKDSASQPKATGVVDGAARALAKARNKELDIPDPARAFVDEVSGMMEDSAQAAPDPAPAKSPAAKAKPPAAPLPGIGNAPYGGPVTLGPVPGRPVPEADDPWAPKKKVETVPPGAKIKLGGDKKGTP